MDSQSFNYWLSQGNYMPPQHTHIFELSPEISQVPSLSGSPVSSTFDPLPPQVTQEYYTGEPIHFGAYPPMTPSDLDSDHDNYCGPQPLQHGEPIFAQMPPASTSGERTHTTSGRRRAQNRAAQRAFRERKEKHARDLEVQLAALTEKYNKLESSHSQLNAAHDKLRKTIELLTQDDEAAGQDENSNMTRRRSSNPDTLRKLLEILHGEFKGVAVKGEST